MATINGTENNDFLLGSRDDADAMFGGNGNDVLYGINGNDRIYGEEGDDFLAGGYGSDTLSGGNGNDVLKGHPGDNIFNSGINDRDILYGGGGSDTFILGTDYGSEYDLNKDTDLAIIEDFKSGEDKIQLYGYSFLYTLTRVGSNTNISIDKGENGKDDLIAIVKSSDLSFNSSDFTFV